MNLSLTFSRRIWLLILLLVLGTILTGGFQSLLSISDIDQLAQIRISSVAQQLLMFMLPAVCTALFITRRPADFLEIKGFPRRRTLLAAMLTMIASIPAMNAIVELFELLPWSESIREAEANIESLSDQILGHGIPNTIIALCIMAILPGLCEELFFRGALMNLFRTRPMSVHLSVWAAAIIFSAMHLQPIGFVPRMLLGAGFGYLTVWTGSLWTAIVCHTLNNAIVIVIKQAGIPSDVVGLSTPVWCVISVIITALGLRAIYIAHKARRSSTRGQKSK